MPIAKFQPSRVNDDLDEEEERSSNLVRLRSQAVRAAISGRCAGQHDILGILCDQTFMKLKVHVSAILTNSPKVCK